MSSQDDELDLRSHLAVLRRRRMTIFVTAAAILVVAVLVSTIQRAQYRATSEVLLQQSQSAQVLNPTQQQNAVNDQARVQTEIEVMRSRSIVDAVTQVLGERPTVDIEAKGDTNVVSISAEDGSKEEAAHIAQTYADTYIKVRRDQVVTDLLAAASQVQDQIDQINGQITDLNAEVTALNNRIAATDDPTVRQDLAAQRDQLQASNASQIQGLQTRLTTYTGQLQNLQLAGNLNGTGPGQIVSDAEVPSSPVSPKPIRNGLIALFVGLLLGVGLAFLRDYLDDTIKSKDDVDAALGGLAVLTLVPQVEEWKDPSLPQLVTVRAPKSPAAEAYRTLRTSVQFVGLERPLKLIQVTSPAAAEGKTTTLANLAVALAQAGKRVVMADCDWRRPRVESFFGVRNDLGFTNVVVGESTLADAVQVIPSQPLLAVLPAGPPPPNPSELLGTRHTADLLRTLAEEVDYVLVDSPPILPVTDGIIIAGIVDATIMVVTANSTTKRESQRALELLEQVSAPLIGAVLNGVDGSGSGYGRGYGYSYGHDPAPRRSRWRRWRRTKPAPSSSVDAPISVR